MKLILQTLGRVIHFLAWPAYWVYFRRGGVRTRVIVRSGSDVLVVKQWLSDGKWQLPGGGTHKDEDMAVGAARELREETGINLSPTRLQVVGSGHCRRSGLEFDFRVYATTVTSRTVQIQNIELYDAQWLSVSAFDAKNTRADALDAIRMLES